MQNTILWLSLAGVLVASEHFFVQGDTAAGEVRPATSTVEAGLTSDAELASVTGMDLSFGQCCRRSSGSVCAYSAPVGNWAICESYNWRNSGGTPQGCSATGMGMACVVYGDGPYRHDECVLGPETSQCGLNVGGAICKYYQLGRCGNKFIIFLGMQCVCLEYGDPIGLPGRNYCLSGSTACP